MSYFLVAEDKDGKRYAYGYFPDNTSASNVKAYLEGYTSSSKRKFMVIEQQEKTEKVPEYKNAGEFISSHADESSL